MNNQTKMNYARDLAGIPLLEDPFSYRPEATKRSDAIKRMQAKFGGSAGDSGKDGKVNDPPPKKVFTRKVVSTAAYANQSLGRTFQKPNASSSGPGFVLKKVQEELLKKAREEEPVPEPQEELRPVQARLPAKKAERSKAPGSPAVKPKNTITATPKSPATKPKKTVSFPARGVVQKTKQDAEQTKPRGWEFGKKKDFVRHAATPRNNKAAMQLQRIARGGMQRMHFKIMRLQHLLDTRQERTDRAVADVRKDLAHKKDVLLSQAKVQLAIQDRKLDQAIAVSTESRNVIAYLRKENKKLREKNEEIAVASLNMKAQNRRLEEANKHTEENLKILREHADHIEDTHRKLNEVIPKYLENIDVLQDAVNTRDAYCIAEHKIKVMYTKLMGDVVEKVENRRPWACEDRDQLEEEIMELCLDMDGKEHDVPVPTDLEEKWNSSQHSPSLASSLHSSVSVPSSDEGL